jgi:polar amino acid transport system ATP-binding protein
MKISLQGVVKRFGATIAVDRTHLEIADGELFTLLGPSGCGKTTLLRLIAGFYSPPDEGTIHFGERRVERLPPYERNIGMVFQNYALWPHMTVGANITYGLRLRKLPVAEIASRLERGLRQVNLVGLAERFPGQLSGGQQQRVALVRALATRPRALLLDEITSALDPELVGEVLEVVRELKAEGMTMLIATHEMGFARDFANEVCFLHEGRILERGAPDRVLSDPQQPETQRFLHRLLSAGRA